MSDLMTIDAHQHYWHLQHFTYAWHQQVNRPEMHRDYLPADILPEMQAAGIEYGVLIEADNPLAETIWMLEPNASHRLQGLWALWTWPPRTWRKRWISWRARRCSRGYA